MSDFDIVIGDVAAGADIAARRDASLEYNFETSGYRDGRSPSCFINDDGNSQTLFQKAL